MLLGWTGDNGDPGQLPLRAAGLRRRRRLQPSRWCHKPFDDLLREGQADADVGERTKLYEEAQVVFKEEAPWVTIAHSVVFKPVRKEVVDFQIDPFGGHVFYGVDLQE